MQHGLVEHLGGTRIQVIFRNRESCFLLAGNATLEHIALTLGEISKNTVERPVAVYVTMERPDC